MLHAPVYKSQQKSSFNLLPVGKRSHLVLVRVSTSYPKLVGRLPTCYSPIRRSSHRRPPEGFSLLHALDLHVLGTPPAFVLSQDQTLHNRKFDAYEHTRIHILSLPIFELIKRLSI